MAGTEPYDWSPGETVTAARMDAEIRDNMKETAWYKVTAAGQIPYASAAKELTVLAPGSNGDIIRYNGGVPTAYNIGIGLSAMDGPVAASTSTVSTSLVAKGDGPSLNIVVPGNGKFFVYVDAQFNHSVNSEAAIMGFNANGTLYDNVARRESGSSSGEDQRSGIRLVTGETPGATISVSARYRSSSAGSTATFQNRTLIVMPAP